MKKSYFSLHRIFVLVLFLSFVIIYSCRKESTPKTGVTDSKSDKSATLITEAKAYLDSALKTNSTTIKLSSTKGSSGPATFNGYLFWDKAKSYLNNQLEVVEVPVALDYKQTNFYKLGGDTSAYVTDKAVAEAAFTRVLIYRDSSNKIIDKRIITCIPDKSYLAKNPNPAENNWINSIDKKFSGYIEYRNWNNEVNMVIRMFGGKVKYLYNVTAVAEGSAILKTEGLKTNSTTCVTYMVPDMVTVCYGSICDTHFNGTYSYFKVCYNSADDDVIYKPKGLPIPPGAVPVYTGGGNPSSNVSNADIANSTYVDDGKTPIDPTKFIKCFTDGKTASQYKLTIYVDQPKQGSNDQISMTSYSGEQYTTPQGVLYNVGHAFVGFQKINTDNTSVTQVMGFYPETHSLFPTGAIKDDGGHGYSVSYTVNVSASEFNSALNVLSNQNTNVDYVLSNVNHNEFNCIDAALTWTLAGGISLPTSASRGVFKNSPGDYGQALRTVNGSNTTPGYAPVSHGACN